MKHKILYISLTLTMLFALLSLQQVKADEYDASELSAINSNYTYIPASGGSINVPAQSYIDSKKVWFNGNNNRTSADNDGKGDYQTVIDATTYGAIQLRCDFNDAFAFKLSKGTSATLKVYFQGVSSRGINILETDYDNETPLGSAQGKGRQHQEITGEDAAAEATVEASFRISAPDADKVFWIKPYGEKAASKVAFGGFKIVLDNASDLVTISDDFSWFGSNNILTSETLFNGNMLYNGGKAKSPSTAVSIDGTDRYPYLYDVSTTSWSWDRNRDYLGMKVNPGTRMANLKVYYALPTATTDRVVTADEMTGAGWTTVTVSGNTITFPENDTKETKYYGTGWSFNPGVTGYNCFSVTLASEANIILSIEYTDGTKDGDYNPVGTVHKRIVDPTKTVEKVILQYNAPSGTTPSITITDCRFTNVDPIVKTGGTSFDSATEVTTTKTTETGYGVLTYTIPQNTTTPIYVTGGLIAGVEVEMDIDPTALSPITEDFVWYALGTALYTKERADNKLIINKGVLNAGAEANNLYVNGSNASLDPVYASNTNVLAANQALAFKLGANKSYVVQIFSDHATANDCIKKITSTSSDYITTNCYSQQIIKTDGSDTNTYLLTYEITVGSSDEVYRIDSGTAMTIGAIEVFPIPTGQTLTESMKITTSTKWAVEDYNSTIKEADNYRKNASNVYDPLSLDKLDTSSPSPAVLYGPTLMVNSSSCNVMPSDKSVDYSTTVMINSNNAIGFVVKKNATVYIPFMGDANHNVQLYKGGSSFTDTKELKVEGNTSYGHGSLTYTATDDTEYLWVTVADDHYMYIPGVYVEYANRIEFDTNVDGIFTGKHNGKLLIYCTDNGTTENYKIPTVKYYANKSDAGTDITNTVIDEKIENTWVHFCDNARKIQVTYSRVNAHTGSYGTNNNEPNFKGGEIVGFEDTDNDKLYLVTYTNLTDGTTNSYYLWYANYLKVGYWVTRDAKLIVNSQESKTDDEHIIVGDYYVSSGTGADFYYEVLTTTDFTGVEYEYTNDNGSTSKVTHSINEYTGSDPKEIVRYDVSTNDAKEGTVMQMHLDYPKDDKLSNWEGTELKKTMSFKVKRSGWPDWTIKLNFYFIRAPKIEIVNYSKGSTKYTEYDDEATKATVKFTGYEGSKDLTESSSASIYYTTDGNMPLHGTSPAPNNSYTITSGETVDFTKDVSLYASEQITTSRYFYVKNPILYYYQTGENPTATTNQFMSMSSLCEVKINDPKIECLNENYKLERNDHGEVTEDSDYFDNTKGGFVKTYPFDASDDKIEMRALFGTISTPVIRSPSGDKVFAYGGVLWKADANTGFNEHLNRNTIKYWLQGYGNNGEIGDPYAECNENIGASGTENGGMFLTPVGGDFLRFEPEYDGVITLWIRQNGAAQGNERNGNITRRPVYIMDENGKLMKRSTIKPTSENYYSIDGSYVEINSNLSQVREDFRIDWLNGLKVWNDNYEGAVGVALPNGNKGTFRINSYWFGFPMYQRVNTLNHTGGNGKMKYSFDLADSWVSRTAKLRALSSYYNSVYYLSDDMIDHVEPYLTFTNNDGSTKTVKAQSSSAKYGYELPSFSTVRYRFPVKAGKSYYIGGRGTKNGFAGYKFEPMKANYTPSDYRTTYNWEISEEWDETDKAESFSISSVTAGDETYDASEVAATYTSTDTAYDTLTLLCGDGYNDKLTTANDDLFDLTIIDNGNAMQGTTCDVTLNRKFKADCWYSIVLPFSVSESRMQEIFGSDVVVLYLDPYNNTYNGSGGNYKSAVNPAITSNKLTFTWHKYQMLYANIPAFICPSQSVETFPTFKRVTIDKTNLGSSGYDGGIGYKIGELGDYDYYVTGAYKYTEKDDIGEMYYLDNTLDQTGEPTGKTTVFHASSGVDMKATRAWITVKKERNTAPERAPLLMEVGFNTFDGADMQVNNSTSGIEDIVMDDMTIEMYDDDCVYDLLGRVVGYGSTDGLGKGVYIFKGKKVYVR